MSAKRISAWTPRRSSIGIATALCVFAAPSLPSALTAQETAPEPGTPRAFMLPEGEVFTLANGVRVTMVPYGTTPKVNVSLIVRTGNVDERPDEVWLADLTGDLMQEGTTTRSATDLATAAAAMGGSLNVGVGLDQTTIGGAVLSEFGADLVELIADVARNPALPASELERLKGDRVRQVSITLQQARPIALAEFRRRMYPEHPYGRLFPTTEMIQSFTLDHVRAFWEENYGAERARIYVSGRFDPRAVRAAIEDHFADWASGAPAAELAPSARTGREIFFIDRPGAPQSTIYLGLPVVDPSHPDYVATQVTNSLLGGSFASRITSNIREDKGYTYSPASQLSVRVRDAYWVQVADVTSDVTGPALDEIFYEIERLGSEAPGQEELQGIQNYMAGLFVLQNSSRGGIINQLAFIDLHGLSSDYLTGYVGRVHALTPADVQRITREQLRADDMLLVVVGDSEVALPQLRKFGSVQVVGGG